MSDPIPARYYDGETLVARPVLVALTPSSLHITGENLDLTVPLADAARATKLGRLPRFIRMPGGGHLALPPDPAVDARIDRSTAPSRYARLLHTLESHTHAATASLLLLVVVVASSLWFALPALARRAAYATPVELEKQAGRAAFTILDQQFGPQARTQLPPLKLRRTQVALRKMTDLRRPHVEPMLMLRNLNVPNAFAFPGGAIVMSDSLVDLLLAEPNGDDLLCAVFAHELAHIERRHGLQLVLRQSATLVAVATITGDLSTLTAFSTTLPFLLIQRGYARDFESEADRDALEMLRAAKVDPETLPRALELLENARPDAGTPDFTYLSTHPSTDDRVRSLRAAK
jgi:Zn-dependent protease with chaperone function